MIRQHPSLPIVPTPNEPPYGAAAALDLVPPASRRRWVGVGFVAAVVVVVVLAGCATLIGIPASASLAPALTSPSGSGLLPASAISSGCNPSAERYSTPTALLIPNSNPSVNVVPGDHVNVTFEFQVNAETIRPNAVGIQVYTPTVFITMPTIGGTDFPVTFNNYTFTITGPQWISLSFNKLVTSNFTFNPAQNASLSTQKVGTMADTPYGTLKLQWRWTWNVTTPNGSYAQGPWTVPTLTTKHDAWLPSIFKPAPYVDLESESPGQDLIGSNYSMYLGGDVAGRAFYIEFESESGVLEGAEWVYDNATTNATFLANVTMLGFGHYLYPGLYLVHIHDSCGAMLYSKRVTLSYPATATIQFFTTPTGCGTITFNGIVYSGGQSAVVVPSPTRTPSGSTPAKGTPSRIGPARERFTSRAPVS